ncbi:DUF1761 domain-containing protein [Gammaproteobacteria bacterium]|jgi:hypothetical protein|nr:DUF1761 domain-containing protein [Gammaproteobacteria bacterium]
MALLLRDFVGSRLRYCHNKLRNNLMEALTANVNWLGVGLSTIICFMLGALWFSGKLFGEKWAEGIGIEIGPDHKQSVSALVSQFFGTLLLAWIVGLAVSGGSIASVVLITLAVFFLVLASNLMGDHTLYASMVEGGFVIAMTIIMTICNVIILS